MSSTPTPDPYAKGLLFFYVETPLHAGCGEGLGAIDLPIQRERMSELPLVQSSGIKGALREQFRPPRPAANESAKDREAREAREEIECVLFGPRPPEKDAENATAAPEHAGALLVTDAKLLLLPLRTVHGGWAWATSPMILERLQRELVAAGLPPIKDIPRPTDDQEAIVLKDAPSVAPQQKLIIEDNLYTAVSAQHPSLLKLLKRALPAGTEYDSLRARIAEQVVILSDSELKFWAKHGTEVTTRVRIDPDTGTVQDGALWTEESLPAEALLWSLTLVGRDRRPRPGDRQPARDSSTTLFEKFATKLDNKRLFVGGDRTIGRGLCSVNLVHDQNGKEQRHGTR